VSTARRSSVVAIDVVLVPPASVRRRAIAASAALRGAIRLGRRAVPHITLAMASVPRAALPEVLSRLRDVARRSAPVDVRVERTLGVAAVDHVTAWYEVARRRDLLALHREAVRALQRYRNAAPTRDALAVVPGERVSAFTLRWIARFAHDSALARYRPHVTLGYGQPSRDPALPLTFRATRFAVYQLGNHCTCARRLAEFRLSPDRML